MSTIKVNKIENTATASGGVAIDVDGHVTVDGQQLPTAGPLSNRNMIINGAMQVAQRSTSSITIGYGSVDRFDNQYNGGTVTGSQETLNSSDTGPWEKGFRNYMRQTNTAAVTSQSTSHRYFRYFIESRDVAGSGWECANASSNITVSFWVRASVAQEYYFYIRSDDGTRKHYCFSTGSLTAGTWTFVTKTIPGTAGLEFDNDNGRGLELALAGYWGTDFTDPAVALDTWGDWDGTARTPDYTNTWGNTVGATLDLTGVQLEVGSKSTPFEHRSYGDQLQRCQRYYQQFSFGSYGSFAPIGRKGGAGYTEHDSTIPHGPMRAAPSGTWLGDLVGFRLSRLHDAAATTPTAVTIVGSSDKTFTFRASTSSYSVGDLVAQWSSGNPSLQSYELSAEL